MSQTINLSLYNHTKFPVDEQQLTRKSQEILQDLPLAGILEIAVTISGKKYIRALNRRFRHIDRPTDVLSFPVNPLKRGNATKRSIPTNQETPVNLGDIVICYAIANRQANQHNRSTQEEINFLFSHGLKHLIGFHHKEN